MTSANHATRSTPGRADLVLRNGFVYTACPAAATAQAVAVSGSRIVDVGSDRDLQERIGPETEVIDLRGRMVLPGFRDGHLHPLLGGVGLNRCDLAGLLTPADCLAKICAYAREHPEKGVITGGGWAYGCFGEQGPTKDDLDGVCPDRPAILKAIDGHSAWVNSAALALAGVRRETPDPHGGRIQRDPLTGEPSGTLREWSAMDLVEERLPPTTMAEQMAGARSFLREAARLGITAAHDAMVSPERLAVYAQLEEQGELTLRMGASLLCAPDRGVAQVPELVELARQHTSRFLGAGSVKLFVDGVVESHTALLAEPYADRPGYCGERLWDPQQFQQTVTEVDRQGLRLHFHAVGDAAVAMSLDALESARRRNGPRDARHQIAHLDMATPADIARMAALGVIANVQPAWAYIDNVFFDSTLPYLGQQRAANMYRFQSMDKAGVCLICGSDWPFGGDSVSLNPLDGIQTGLTRLGIGGLFPNVYLPEERLSLDTLLLGCTARGAYAEFQAAGTGSLEAGKAADLIVLDRNLFAVPAEEIHEARVLLTLFNGRAVYRAPDLA